MGKKKSAKGRRSYSNSEARPLLLKDKEQEYAKVVKVLGNCKFLLNVAGQEMIGSLRGTMRKRRRSHWVGQDSVVLISLRDFQENRVDILHVYKAVEVRKLQKHPKEDKRYEEVVKDRYSGALKEEEDDCGFEFDDI